MSKSKIFFFIEAAIKRWSKRGVKWSSIAQGPAICHASDVIFINVYWKRNG